MKSVLYKKSSATLKELEKLIIQYENEKLKLDDKT